MGVCMCMNCQLNWAAKLEDCWYVYDMGMGMVWYGALCCTRLMLLSKLLSVKGGALPRWTVHRDGDRGLLRTDSLFSVLCSLFFEAH